ncbi:MAG: hypothetical protein IJF11_05555 [Clostridia bacterium]|nr:hypothetical protein [Clostridia bacterium]
MKFKISERAANEAIKLSNEAAEDLSMNMRVLDSDVNAKFAGLQDPTIKKYLELSEEMQIMLRTVSDKMEQIETYCRRIIQWINDYRNT